jgi:hypothetical protein
MTESEIKRSIKRIDFLCGYGGIGNFYSWLNTLSHIIKYDDPKKYGTMFLDNATKNQMIANAGKSQPFNRKSKTIYARVICPLIIIPHNFAYDYYPDSQQAVTMDSMIKTYEIMVKLPEEYKEKIYEFPELISYFGETIDPMTPVYHTFEIFSGHHIRNNIGKKLIGRLDIYHIEKKDLHILNFKEIMYLKDKLGVTEPLF